MQLLSHDRLNELKAQREHLVRMHEHHVMKHILRLAKLGVPNDQVQAEAEAEADAEFHDAGLTPTAKRIRLEIEYLEAELL
jgi:hypothetical protein